MASSLSAMYQPGAGWPGWSNQVRTAVIKSRSRSRSRMTPWPGRSRATSVASSSMSGESQSLARRWMSRGNARSMRRLTSESRL